MRRFLFLSLLILTTSAAETHPPFRPDLPAGAAYALDARKLHPTQFSHGWREVVYKAAKINAMSPAAVTAYLTKKDVPVVIGPGGVPYMTDGHHTLRSLIESNAPDKTAYGHILANWSDLDAATFWARMEVNNYAYLKNAHGRSLPPAALPASLLVMERDPWRSLAWGVMEARGFAEQKGVFFQEFRWADFFRDKVKWDDADDDAFDVLTLLDVGTRRAFEVVTATYGDSRYGRVFDADGPLVVATITDSDIGACTVERGLEGTPCADATPCAPGICLGVVREEVCVDGVCTPTDVVLGEGRCVRTRVPDERPSRGATCTGDATCPRAEGLTCSLLGDGPDAVGFCEDAWLRRRFAFEGAAIEGAETTIPLVVSGVASVSLRTTLSAVISHPRPADLTVSLQHPGGGSSAVVFADPGATGTEIVLRDVRALLPSDEGINGTWSLLVEDAGGSVLPPGSAFAFGLELEVASWFD